MTPYELECWQKDRIELVAECDRLRAEKAELLDILKPFAAAGYIPKRLLTRIREIGANETEGK